jgi:hypothetical protein
VRDSASLAPNADEDQLEVAIEDPTRGTFRQRRKHIAADIR